MPPSDRFTFRLVLLGWAALAAALGWYVAKFGAALPAIDEWDTAQVFAGRVSVWHIAFGHHNQHRFPPQVLWYAVTRAAGHDFRAGMAVSALAMAAAALGLILAARRVTGRTSPADVLFPALLLHLGFTVNWLVGAQQAVVLPMAAAIGAVALAAVCRPGNAVRVGCAAGGLLLVAMTGGGYGLAVAPFLGGWLAVVGWDVWTRTGRAGPAAAVLVAPVLAAGYVGFCAATLDATGGPPRPASSAAGEAFAAVHGLATVAGWTPAVYAPWLGFVVGGAAVAVGGRLAWVAATRPDDRLRAVGLLAGVAGPLAAGAVVVLARGCVTERHTVPMAALGCGLVLALRAFPLPVPGGRWWGIAGAAVAVAVVAVNWRPGLSHGYVNRYHYDLFRADLRAGMPARFLADKHVANLIGWPTTRGEPAWLAERIECYRAADLKGFRDATPTPPTVELPGSASPVCFRGPNEPSAAVPGPGRFVVGARVTLRADGDTAWMQVLMEWPGDGPASRTASVYLPTTSGREETVVFWVNDAPREVTFRAATPTARIVVADVRWLAPVP